MSERQLYHGVKWFKQSFDAGTSGVELGSGQGGLFQIRLADLPDAPNFQQLFQQFTVKSFTVKLVPSATVYDAENQAFNAVNTLSVARPPVMWWAVNRTPFPGTVASSSEVMAEDDAKMVVFDKPISITVHNPLPALPTATPGATLATWGDSTPKWLNTGGASSPGDASGVYWSGVKFWLEAPGYTPNKTNFTYRIFITAKLGMKEQI